MSPRAVRNAQNQPINHWDATKRPCTKLREKNLLFDELLLQNAESQRGAAVLPPRGLSIKSAALPKQLSAC